MRIQEKNQREVINFWKELNSIPKELTMQQHEQVLMLTAHLPHVLAFIMIKVLFEKSSDEGTKRSYKKFKRLFWRWIKRIFEVSHLIHKYGQILLFQTKKN